MREGSWEYITESKQNGHYVYEIRLIRHVASMNYLDQNHRVAGGYILDCVQHKNENILVAVLMNQLTPVKCSLHCATNFLIKLGVQNI